MGMNLGRLPPIGSPQWPVFMQNWLQNLSTDVFQCLRRLPQTPDSNGIPLTGPLNPTLFEPGEPIDDQQQNGGLQLAQALANIALGTSGQVEIYDGLGSTNATDSGSAVSAFARTFAVASGDFVYVAADDEGNYEIVGGIDSKYLRAVAQSSGGPGSNVTVKLYAGFGTGASLATQTTTVYNAAFWVINGFTIYVARGLDGNYEVVEAATAVVGQAGTISAGSLTGPAVTTTLTVYLNGAKAPGIPTPTVTVRNYNPGLSAPSGKSAGAVWNGVEWVWSWVDC